MAILAWRIKIFMNSLTYQAFEFAQVKNTHISVSTIVLPPRIHAPTYSVFPWIRSLLVVISNWSCRWGVVHKFIFNIPRPGTTASAVLDFLLWARFARHYGIGALLYSSGRGEGTEEWPDRAAPAETTGKSTVLWTRLQIFIFRSCATFFTLNCWSRVRFISPTPFHLRFVS